MGEIAIRDPERRETAEINEIDPVALCVKNLVFFQGILHEFGEGLGAIPTEATQEEREAALINARLAERLLPNLSREIRGYMAERRALLEARTRLLAEQNKRLLILDPASAIRDYLESKGLLAEAESYLRSRAEEVEEHVVQDGSEKP